MRMKSQLERALHQADEIINDDEGENSDSDEDVAAPRQNRKSMKRGAVRAAVHFARLTRSLTWGGRMRYTPDLRFPKKL